MDIFINGEPVAYKPVFPLSWGNLFQKLLQDNMYIPKDHGIVGVLVDGGEALNVMTEESDRLVPLGIMRLDIFTKDSLNIAKDGFAKVLTLLDSIKAEINAAADLYREGQIHNASQKIVRIMEAIKPMVNFISSVGSNFSLNFDEIRFDNNSSLREKVEYFLKSFEDLINAQQKKDYVEIADYLEYQLIEDMDDWKKIVNLLIREAEASKAQSA